MYSWEGNWACCSYKGAGFPSPGFPRAESDLWEEEVGVLNREQCMLGSHH